MFNFETDGSLEGKEDVYLLEKGKPFLEKKLGI